MTDLNLKLYLVTNRGQHSEASFLSQIEAALVGGVTCVQLREKETTSRDFYQLALKVKAQMCTTCRSSSTIALISP